MKIACPTCKRPAPPARKFSKNAAIPDGLGGWRSMFAEDKGAIVCACGALIIVSNEILKIVRELEDAVLYATKRASRDRRFQYWKILKPIVVITAKRMEQLIPNDLTDAFIASGFEYWQYKSGNYVVLEWVNSDLTKDQDMHAGFIREHFKHMGEFWLAKVVFDA